MAVLAQAVWNPDRLLPIAEDLDATHFYRPDHQALWLAIRALVAEGTRIDALTVAARAAPFGYQGGADYVFQLAQEATIPHRATVELLLAASASRDVLQACSEALKAIGSSEDPWIVSEALQSDLAALGSIRPKSPEAKSLDAWLAMDDEEGGEWIIEDMITRDTLALLIGAEGVGKAVWLRQIGMCAAQGIHPVFRWDIPPIRVLYCDFENPLRNIKFPAKNLSATLKERKGENYDQERFYLWRRRRGLNVLRHRDRADFEREIAHFRPDLVLLGPLNRFYSRVNSRQNYEDVAGDVIDILALLREKYRFGLVIEHHMPKDRKDPQPMGSQRWMGDPDLGIVIKPDETDPFVTKVSRFRGDRFEVKWPSRLERDPDWVVRCHFD